MQNIASLKYLFFYLGSRLEHPCACRSGGDAGECDEQVGRVPQGQRRETVARSLRKMFQSFRRSPFGKAFH